MGKGRKWSQRIKRRTQLGRGGQGRGAGAEGRPVASTMQGQASTVLPPSHRPSKQSQLSRVEGGRGQGTDSKVSSPAFCRDDWGGPMCPPGDIVPLIPRAKSGWRRWECEICAKYGRGERPRLDTGKPSQTHSLRPQLPASALLEGAIEEVGK